MATKNTDTCLQNAREDEPIFVLRSQDITAPELVEAWATRAVILGAKTTKINEARKLAQDMRRWQEENGCKLPD